MTKKGCNVYIKLASILVNQMPVLKDAIYKTVQEVSFFLKWQCLEFLDESGGVKRLI